MLSNVKVSTVVNGRTITQTTAEVTKDQEHLPLDPVVKLDSVHTSDVQLDEKEEGDRRKSLE